MGILIALRLKADILECLIDEALAFAASADTEGTQHDIEVVMHGLVGQELEVLEDDAKRRRSFGSSLLLMRERSKPMTLAFPLVRGTSAEIVFSRVLFPEPTGPVR